MTQVRINGEESGLSQNQAVKVVDLVELVKTQIDPDHMITGIMLDGKELSESDWHAIVQNFGTTAIIEIETGTPKDYIADRLSRAADIVRACYIDFRDARKFFQSGDTQHGNQKLSIASNTMKAFFEWYQSLLELMPTEERERFHITQHIETISECFKQSCQHQLYQSWWALGETIEKDLEPKLDKLEDFCRGIAKAM